MKNYSKFTLVIRYLKLLNPPTKLIESLSLRAYKLSKSTLRWKVADLLKTVRRNAR